ncbi:MAG: tannase/feruloyl esterase family alpha/beta hydrolase, partial [Bacteroidales bacterium]
MEAQRYPGDFDGIVAGAPAFSWPATAAEFIQNTQAIYPDPDDLDHPVITLANLELLQSVILQQCDELDGIRDRIINDPGDCDLEKITFPGCTEDTPADDCFTSEQLEAIKTVYAGVNLENHE